MPENLFNDPRILYLLFIFFVSHLCHLAVMRKIDSVSKDRSLIVILITNNYYYSILSHCVSTWNCFICLWIHFKLVSISVIHMPVCNIAMWYDRWLQLLTIYHYHHHISPSARISLTLSRHPSLSSITSGRSSGIHPVSAQSCCVYFRAGHPAFARPCEEVHSSTSLMWSSLFPQQCPLIIYIYIYIYIYI